MEDFDFDFDNEVGTQIDNLKEKNNQNYTDTDLDYDKIIDNLISTQPSNNKKKSNINNIVNKISTDINNKKKFDLNFNPIQTRNNCLIKNNNDNDNDDDDNDDDNDKPEIKISLLNKLKKFLFYDNKDIMIIILIFILINTHFIIDLINNKVSFIKNINNIYPNLIIRTIIFGLSLIHI